MPPPTPTPGQGVPPPATPTGGVDMASQYASYWANYYSTHFAQKHGIVTPSPTQGMPRRITQQGQTSDALAKEEAAGRIIRNPHTGEVVAANNVVNPYTQTSHPYAYRDYGWNRPKRKQTSIDQQNEANKVAAKRSLQEQRYDPQEDPNHNYGPNSSKRIKGRTHSIPNQQQNQVGGVGKGIVKPGTARVKPKPQPTSLPKFKGKKNIIPSEQEQEALNNDEPLAF